MKKMFIIILIVGSIFLLNPILHADEQREYLSPDGNYHAYVISLPKSHYGSGESRIDLRSANGALLLSKSYGSEDGEHGFGVERAAWTPDSRYFVYSMSSSGGHQSWHFPTYFIATHDFKLHDLDDYLGLITTPDFKLTPPDIIQVVGHSIADLEKEVDFKVTLSDLIKKTPNKSYL